MIRKSWQKLKNSALVAVFSRQRCCESLRTVDEISKVLFWVFSTPPTIHQVKPTRIVSYFTLPPHLQGKIEKHDLPKSVVRLTVDSRPTVHRHGRQNRDDFRKYELSRLSQIGENFISDQQLFDTLMTIDRYCCKTLQIPSTLHQHTHTTYLYCGNQWRLWRSARLKCYRPNTDPYNSFQSIIFDSHVFYWIEQRQAIWKATLYFLSALNK